MQPQMAYHYATYSIMYFEQILYIICIYFVLCIFHFFTISFALLLLYALLLYANHTHNNSPPISLSLFIYKTQINNYLATYTRSASPLVVPISCDIKCDSHFISVTCPPVCYKYLFLLWFLLIYHMQYGCTQKQIH